MDDALAGDTVQETRGWNVEGDVAGVVLPGPTAADTVHACKVLCRLLGTDG